MTWGQLNSERSDGSDAGAPDRQAPAAPRWIADSPPLADAYALAAEAHAAQLRATDRAPFLDHVVEVATILNDAGFDEELVAAALLHDAVERGTLTEERLRRAVDEDVCDLVLALTEDESIEVFDERKAALRGQVQEAGARAITIFAADKLSDIRGLQRGISQSGNSIEERMGTTVDGMAGHYRESVEMIEESEPDSELIPMLHHELECLVAPTAVERG